MIFSVSGQPTLRCVALCVTALSLCTTIVKAEVRDELVDGSPPIAEQILRLPAQVEADSQKQRWWDITMKGGDLFDKIILLDKTSRKRELEALVAAFGTDAEVDMAIVSSTAPYFLAKGVSRPFSSYIDRADTQKEKEGAKKIAVTDQQMVRLLVQRLLSEPTLLERYYVLNRWYQHRLRGTYKKLAQLARLYGDDFPSSQDPEYWWYVRQFLILARATDRLDLIENTPHDQFDKAFEEWHKWFQAHSSRLIQKKDNLYWSVGKREVREHGNLPKVTFPLPGLNVDNFFPQLNVLLDKLG